MRFAGGIGRATIRCSALGSRYLLAVRGALEGLDLGILCTALVMMLQSVVSRS